MLYVAKNTIEYVAGGNRKYGNPNDHIDLDEETARPLLKMGAIRELSSAERELVDLRKRAGAPKIAEEDPPKEDAPKKALRTRNTDVV